MKPQTKTITLLLGLILFQAVFSFVSPVYDPSNTCQHSADYFLNTNVEKMTSELKVGKSELSLTDKFFTWFPDYHMICDSTSFLLLAKNWPQTYYERNIYIDHPLYNFFASLFVRPLSWFMGTPSYPVIFGVFMLVNFLLLFATAFFIYQVLSDLISPRVALWSGILLIFSPFVHTMINQPTSSGMIEIFVVASSLWLLWRYIKKPSANRLVIFSLLFGVLLLGKQIAALSLFVLLLAACFKKYKEGLIFLALHLLPTALWFLYVKYSLHLPYYLVNVSSYDQGTWFLKAQYWQFYTTSNILVSAIPKFFSNLIYGFILLPVVFSFYGLYRLEFKYKYLFYFGMFAGFFSLFFAMNLFRATLSFLLFPVIYPTAVVGIEKIGEFFQKYGGSWPKTFFYLCILIIIFFSSLNYYLLVPQN